MRMLVGLLLSCVHLAWVCDKMLRFVRKCMFLCFCGCVPVRRCTRRCRATLNAASTSGGLSPGPFVPSTLWTTRRPAGRESKAERSGQWAGSAWRAARLALLDFTGRVPLAHVLQLAHTEPDTGNARGKQTVKTSHCFLMSAVLFSGSFLIALKFLG